MKELTNLKFKEEIYDYETNEFKNKKFTIIDFYATWCQPCKSIELILKQIENEFDLEIIKINAEDEYQLTEYFQIKNLPTLLYINENNIYTQAGSTTKENIIKKIKQYSNDKILA